MTDKLKARAMEWLRNEAKYGTESRYAATVLQMFESAKAMPTEEASKLNPAVLPALPGQKALTVVMHKDDGDVQADAAIAAVQRGDTFLLPQGVSELFFAQLRLRIALDPSLADKIAVYYLIPGERRYQEASPADPCTKWPVGFCNDLWEKELQISSVKGVADGRAGDKAREVEAALRAKYAATSAVSPLERTPEPK